jgi:CBS domain-containing membrane protein
MRQQQVAQTPITAVMHPHPYRVTAQQPVRELLALFVDKGISAAPVVDAQSRPIGFVSKTDVVRQFHSPRPGERPEGATQVQPWWDAERLAQLMVGDIMTPAVYSFTPETTVADAIAVMAFEGTHHLPVVDASGMLVGMVSALDVLDWMARQAGYTPAGGKEGRIFERPA